MQHLPVSLKLAGRRCLVVGGGVVAERKIDLHGMTLSQAHPALNRFILAAHADGCRLVLVVTGKGKTKKDVGPIPTPRGVLRNQVPQ